MGAKDQQFDFTKQLARFGDDFWRLSRFARLFSEETPRRMKAIRIGLAGRDSDAVRVEAEPLAQVLETLGAREAAAIAEDLGRCADDRDFRQARLLVIALEHHVDEILTTVRSWPPVAA